MPVTLHDLYQPMSEFFLTKFGTGAGADVVFRFDKFGSLLTDADFRDENHPERGLQRERAIEKFSDLVNRVPTADGDGANIILTQAAIDDIYCLRLLAPSLPAVPSNADEATKASITASFNNIKEEAKRVWERLVLQSSSGLALNFKPSVAQPEDWYDPAGKQAWTNQTFQIGPPPSAPSTPVPSAPAPATPPPSAPSAPPSSSPLMLRLRPDNQVLASGLGVEPNALRNRPQLMAAIANPAVEPSTEPAPAAAADGGAAPGEDLHGSIMSEMHTIPLAERAIVNHRIREVAPQASVTTSSVSISFDYCLVNVQRPWWMDAFINSGTWYVPGVPAGQLTSEGYPGALRWLPVGFVAVRNLTISAEWSDEDAGCIGRATDFGPFQAEAAGGQTLTHPGLQVIGWLLQKLPALPPADAPVPRP